VVPSGSQYALDQELLSCNISDNWTEKFFKIWKSLLSHFLFYSRIPKSCSQEPYLKVNCLEIFSKASETWKPWFGIQLRPPSPFALAES
jgi:hypothetical protein